MTRRIPPLNPLRVFEVVARTENLTAAAAELHVTQSAVSRQIGVLETYLGIELFRRERHGVSLTRAGKLYAAKILPAFDTIAEATTQLLKANGPDTVRVRTYTTFAAKWLIPRLGEFRAKHPGIEVRITNATPDVDFDRDPVDVAIQFGTGQWPRLRAELMFRDEIEPVCSPRFLKRHARDARHPESLLRQPLLVSHYRRVDWDDWLAFADLAPMAEDAPRMSFGTSVLTWQAAVDGLGIAIGQNSLLTNEFESGQLVRPFRRPLHRDMAYYLVRPKLQRATREVRAFSDWLMAASAVTAQAQADDAV